MKRIGIYFFYDSDGIVDKYNELLLQDIQQYCERLVVVCNGVLSPAGRKLFSKITKDVFVRENVGFDVWAYKTALEWIGWDELTSYDELIMFNFTNFAPVFPFENVFAEMDNKVLDFWGLSVFYRMEPAPDWYPKGYIPEHLQSHFIAVRKTMLSSYEFRTYWETRSPINNYFDSVIQHESIFTEYFSDRGFRWSVYAATSEEDIGDLHPVMNTPVDMLERYNFPFVKRKLFFRPYNALFEQTLGYPGRDTLLYLKENTDYPTDVIWENIRRTCYQRDVSRALHLNYVLSTSESVNTKEHENQVSMAAILYVAEHNCFSRYAEYLKNFPKGTKFYLICASEQIQWKEIFGEYIGEVAGIEYAPPEQRAMAVFSLLMNISEQYDYYSVLHFNGAANETSCREAGYQCIENMAATEDYVSQIIRTFENHKYLGMLTIPDLYWGIYWPYYGKESKDYLLELDEISALLGVPYNRHKVPVSPYYGVFWCRGKAVQRMKEVCNLDVQKIMSKVQNRGIYQFWDSALGPMLQAAGFYCGRVMSDRYAAIEYTNLTYQLSEINCRSNCQSVWKLFEQLLKK